MKRKKDCDEFYFRQYVSWLKKEIKKKGFRWREKEQHLKLIIAARMRGII